jgi:hypothetical protein
MFWGFNLLVLLVVGVCARPAINVYDGYESWNGVQPCNISGPFVINQNGPQYRRCNAAVAFAGNPAYTIAISIESYTIALVDRESRRSFKLVKHVADKRFKWIKKLLTLGITNVEGNFISNHSVIPAGCSYDWVKREKRLVLTMLGVSEIFCNSFKTRDLLISFSKSHHSHSGGGAADIVIVTTILMIVILFIIGLYMLCIFASIARTCGDK